MISTRIHLSRNKDTEGMAGAIRYIHVSRLGRLEYISSIFYGLYILLIMQMFVVLLDILYRKKSVKVYFHADGQFLDFSGRMGYKIYVGSIVQAQLYTEDIRLVIRLSLINL